MKKTEQSVIDDVKELARRMMKLFEGFSEAYGTYDGTVRNEDKEGKLEIKATAQTIRKPVTLDLWMKHIEGAQPIGIIPIRDNDTCLWGVIDIDQYTITYDVILKAVEREKLPLIPCRSKSGGVHLFIFMAEPVSAEVMQARLKEMAVIIGYGSSEIFPKQRHVHVDRGDLGSWLNMPYFNGDESNRYGIKMNGMAMTLEEFLHEAESKQQPPIYLEETSFRKKPKNDPDFGDGPPCMQHLAAAGFPEGTRNKGLFALAVFARKKYGDRWKDMVERWNRDYFDPPLPAQELLDIIKGVERKDYNYTCKDTPLVSHCNSSLCRTRKFGVGGEDDFPTIGGLSVLDTEPPVWFLDVENERLELTTEDLQNYKSFHKVCMEKLFKCFRMMKQDTWFGIVATAMRDAVRIEVSEEISKTGHFYELMEEFLTNRHRGESKDDLLMGRPFEDVSVKRYFFRIQDLQYFVEGKGFKSLTRGQMVSRIKSYGGNTHFFNIKGKGVNAWYVPSNFRPMPDTELPAIYKEPI